MVLRRAANVVGDTMAVKTGSSLYSRIGTTHMSTEYLRMIAGRTVVMRDASHRCCVSAWSRRVPNGRTGAAGWPVTPDGRAMKKAVKARQYVGRMREGLVRANARVQLNCI